MMFLLTERRITAHGVRSTLECGGSRHRFPPVPDTEIWQERKQNSGIAFS
jgi:hypothetical protein